MKPFEKIKSKVDPKIHDKEEIFKRAKEMTPIINIVTLIAQGRVLSLHSKYIVTIDLLS